jgi:hypothetical protein
MAKNLQHRLQGLGRCGAERLRPETQELSPRCTPVRKKAEGPLAVRAVLAHLCFEPVWMKPILLYNGHGG